MKLKLIDLKGDLDKSTIVLEYFNSFTQLKISKDTENMNGLNLNDTYGTFQSTIAEYTFFTSTHITFTKNDYILDHKKSIK